MKPTSLKMLIVDDEKLITIMIRDFFKASRPAYRIITAEDGEEGLERCIEEKPDVLITDIMLPKMSGIELITKLRALGDFAVMPIIAITAGALSLQDDARRAGAHIVIEKPIRRIELLQKVDELLEASPFFRTSSRSIR